MSATPPRSRESNQNLLYNEVRNLARRVNEFTRSVQTLQDASQDQALDLEQLSGSVEQIRSKLAYLEEILKELQSR